MLTHPLFLIGLSAIAIPIAIHLLQLRRYRKVYFSNVAMLEQLQNEDRRQRNLRQLLILAARILAIVFLVLAFCQPVIRNKQSRIQPGGTVVSVYVDNSFSMENGGMEGSLLELSRRKAREIAQAYKPDDRFQLLTNDISGSQFRWLSREEFLEAVDRLSISPITTPLSSIMQRQADFLKSSTAANRHAFVISDFQRTTADIASCSADSAVLTTFIPLGGSDVANIYIDSIAFNSPAFYPGSVVRAEVTVRNGGDKPVEQLPLRLFAGGRQRALATVDVAAHSAATSTLTFSLDAASVGGANVTLQGYVETADYPITFDDRLYFSLSVMQRVPMLVVSGGSENIFLRRLFASDTLVSYNQRPVAQFSWSRLSDYHFLVLDELQRLPSGAAAALRQYVTDGGTLLIVPTHESDEGSYNELLAALQAPQLGGWAARKTAVTQVAFDAPLYRGVFQGRLENVEMPVVTGHYRLAVSASSVAQSLMQFVDGSVCLSATPSGNGVLYLFAAPLRAEYTDFVRQALFVPTLYNMALFSQPPQQPYGILAGNAPVLLSGSYVPDAVPHLCAADEVADSLQFDVIPDIRRLGQRQHLVPHGEVTHAGNYLMTLGDSIVEGLSFNYSRQESDLACYAPSDLSRLLRQYGLESCSVMANVQKSASDYIRQRGQGKPLWRWCVLLALLFLLAETLLIRIKPSAH